MTRSVVGTSSLEPGDVHVWRARVGGAVRNDRDDPMAVLSPEERDRAGRFRSLHHGRAFAERRGILRHVLASYVGEAPDALRLAVGDHGKPYLRDHRDLRFNLSNSGELALYAVACGRDVGIDVERVDRRVDHRAVARRAFSDTEQSALARVPEDLRQDAFFTCWARKEAFVKGLGTGMSIPFNGFSVSVDANERVSAVKALDGDAPDWSLWTVYYLDCGCGYASALAVEGPIGATSRWEWAAAGPLEVFPQGG